MKRYKSSFYKNPENDYTAMIRKVQSYSFIGLLFLLCFTEIGYSKSRLAAVVKDSSRFPTDMVLIYNGGPQRLKYNKEQMAPYVYRKTDKGIEWMFDGFLFLEIRTVIDNKAYNFVVNRNPAGKKQWESLLKQTFSENRGPGAIEQILDSLQEKGNKVPDPRKIVIGIPNPVYGDKDWGVLNNKRLDFNRDEDRIASVTWYVDQVLKIWAMKKYSHLQLTGFYWVHEAVANKSDTLLIQALSRLLHQKELDFYWIPYYGARGAKNWRELGFDIAYQQPNYFFKLPTPYVRLKKAIDFAGKYDMAMEMEFDNRLFSNTGYVKKFFDYLNEFRKERVWDHKPVAYYEGGGAWLKMSQSKDPEIMKAFRTLGDIIVERQQQGITENK